MLNKSVARRYAEAFFSIAREANKIDEYQIEFEKVITSLNEVEGMREYLGHHLIPTREKKDLIEKVFGAQLLHAYRFAGRKYNRSSCTCLFKFHIQQRSACRGLLHCISSHHVSKSDNGTINHSGIYLIFLISQNIP